MVKVTNVCFGPEGRSKKEHQSAPPLARTSANPNDRSDQLCDSSCRKIAKIAEENVGCASGGGPLNDCLADHTRVLEVLFFFALFEDEDEYLCGPLPHR